MQPAVSILIPSYRHAPYLEACLRGILAQTFTDWEAVVVDDQSPDESFEVASRFGSDRMRVLRNESNLGTYGTLQRALELSTGKLVAVLNSDDLWRPEKLARQVEALHRHPDAGFCYTLGWMVDAEGSVDDTEDVHLDWPTDERQDLTRWLLYENRVLASSVLFRREGLRFETSCRYSGDWVALLEANRRGGAVCVPDRLTFWRVHGANTFVRTEGQVLEEVRVRLAIARDPRFWLGQPDTCRSWRDVREGLWRNAINLVALYVLAGEMREARRWAWRSLAWRPDKLAAIKRWAVTFAPAAWARRRLWKDDVIEIDRQKLRSMPGLRFEP